MKRRLIAAVAALCCLPGCLSEGGDESLKTQVESLRKEVAALKQEVQRMRGGEVGRGAAAALRRGVAEGAADRTAAARERLAAGGRPTIVQAADPDGSTCQVSVPLTPQGLPDGDHESLERVRRLIEARLQRLGAGEPSVEAGENGSLSVSWKQGPSSRPEAVLQPLTREVALRTAGAADGSEPVKVSLTQGEVSSDCARGQ